MNFQLFINIVNGAGYFWWLPLPCWVAYFFLSQFWDYPAVLEGHIRNGKSWPYLPIFWKGRKKRMVRAASILLFWIANIFGACALYYLFTYKHVALIAVGLGVSAFIGIEIRSISTREIVRLQQDMYFQIYTHLTNQAMLKGDEISNNELASRAQWQQQNDLRHADKQGRLMQFLKGEAML